MTVGDAFEKNGREDLHFPWFVSFIMIFFVAPLPPPINGQSVASAHLLERLTSTHLPCRVLNTAAGNSRGMAGHLVRIGRLLRVVGVLSFSAFRRQQTLYVSLNANHGMILSAIYVALARVGGYAIFVHHHTAAHVNRTRLAMRLVGRFAGPRAVHICQCETMGELLKQRYGTVRNVISLSNAATLVMPAEHDAGGGQGSFTLGHMSNLTMAKGLGIVVDLFTHLRRHGRDVRLIVAGPCVEPAAAEVIQTAMQQFPDHVRYLGRVDGDDKHAFFQAIDLFIFPSQYENETQGIVNLEALAAGVPVVAYGRCCIPEDIDDAGLAIATHLDFVSNAMPYITRLVETPNEAMAARTRARLRFTVLARRAHDELTALIGYLAGDPLADPRGADE